MTTFCLPDRPWQVVRRLAREHGRRVWLVGGAVRSLLLGRARHDWDFAVDRGALALARSTADELGGAYFPLDAERGTGRAVVTTEDGVRLWLDFATLQGGLQTDLAARDFTINAMALDAQGTLVDPMDGRADLGACLIRATGEQVFRDDPVRLLRAVRLAAALGFEIEAQTEALIRRDVALVTIPAPERVRDELVDLLGIQGAAAHVQRLDEFGLLPLVLPELGLTKGVTQSPPHRLDVWRHTLATVDALEGVVAAVTGRELGARVVADIPDAPLVDLARALNRFAGDLSAHLAVEVIGGRDRAVLLALGALLHDIGKPATWSQDDGGTARFFGHQPAGARLAANRLLRLRFGGSEVRRVAAMVRGHQLPSHLACGDEATRRAVYQYFRALGDVGVEAALLSVADHLATWGPHLQRRCWATVLAGAETLLTHYFERHEQTITPTPVVTGHDLMAELGLSAGPEIGRLLELVREAQAAGEVGTREEALALALDNRKQLG